jgi:hypothetical protein
MSNVFNIDLSKVKESGFAPIPEGEYPIIIDDAEVKETRDGTGEYINAKLKILGGDYDGRILFTMFNIKNNNVKAVEIGLSQLKTFCRLSGRGDKTLTDVKELVGHKANAVVKTKVDSYGEKSVVSYFKAFKASEQKANKQDALPF